MYAPQGIRARQSFARGLIPVRFDGAPDSIFTGMGLWRGVPDFEHHTLVRVFGLPDRCHFDLPSTVRGIGPNTRGAAVMPSGRRLINGFVFVPERDTPAGKLTVCFDAERFADRDPSNLSDFLDLGRS